VQTNPIAPMRSVSIPSRAPLAAASLTSSYGMRDHPVLGGRRDHKGIDLAAPTGTPVYATADGVVGRADWFSSYGLFISIAHGGELETRYAHLSRLNVAPGQSVRKGELIGYVGSTGRSTGPHLHYEVRVGGQAVNPMPYMAENSAAAGGVGLASR
jgi:murein DD-endopeptidase MepM/ murein hydrolase activator NlpD